MAVRARSVCLLGIEAVAVDVETEIIGSLRRFVIVGLPDGVLREAKDRVRCALENSGFVFPSGEVIVSLAPASLPKHGAGFDLAIALSILAADRQLDAKKLQRYIVHGELALNGQIKPSPGALSIAEHVRRSRVKGLRLMMAEEDARIAAEIESIKPVAISSLSEAVACISGEFEERIAVAYSVGLPESNIVGFGDVVGQHGAKRALEIAAAGGHNVILIGPPGSGKSMLAQRVPSIMPPLTKDEALIVTRIHSLSNCEPGINNSNRRALHKRGLITVRPFRSPHHTASMAGIIGGGSTPRPGEISLAQHGILFLDEFTELRRDLLESLREPIENGEIAITRAKYSVRYPAEFMLIAAMNPCPCGRLGDVASGYQGNPCRCSPSVVQRYLSKLSGPILDRIDIQVWVPAVPVSEFSNSNEKDITEEMRSRVSAARSIQSARLNGKSRVNSRLTSAEVKKFCAAPANAIKILQRASELGQLSARGYVRALKVARSIADLQGCVDIAPEHVTEALSYRVSVEKLLAHS